MDLKDFIKSTISQIAESVEELNNEFQERQVVVNPSSINGINNVPTLQTHTRAYNITNIDFDLSVSVENNEGSSAKVGVFANVIGIGASATEGKNSQSVSKVKFTIPVMLPSEKPYKD
jgi:hypothetical protein